MVEFCTCCRWQHLVEGTGGSPSVLIGSASSESPISDLFYELIGRISQRLRSGADLVVVSDAASVDLLDAANLDLAELLGAPTAETLAHGVSKGVAIGISRGGDARVEQQLAELRSAGAITITATDVPPQLCDFSADYRIVATGTHARPVEPIVLRPVWRSVVKGVLQLAALSTIEAARRGTTRRTPAERAVR